MSTEEFLREYEETVRTEMLAKAKRMALEMRFRAKQTGEPSEKKPKELTKLEAFIEKHDHKLEDIDREFLTQSSRTTAEVAEYLEVHRNQVAKWLKDGKYRPGRGDSESRRMVDTQSVIEVLLGLDAETTSKQSRNL